MYMYFSTRDTVPSPLSICHLAELDNDTLYLYGPGSLDALDRNWGNQAVQAVSAISFKFIDFDNIVPQLYKIRARFPSLLVSIQGKLLEVYFFQGFFRGRRGWWGALFYT